jgi:hypothetical protein
LLAAGIALMAGAAIAGEYARDPCAAPGVLRSQAATIFTRHDTLAAASRSLDAQGRQHDAQCDRELPAGSAAEVGCAASKGKLAHAIAEHDDRIVEYQRDLAVLIDQALARLEARMAQTRLRLARVTPSAAAWSQDMEAWIELGETARREAQWTGYEKLAALSLERIKTGIDAQLSLAETTRSAFRAWAATARAGLPEGTRAAIEQQVRNLRSGRDVTDMLAFLYDQHSRTYSVVKALQDERGWEASAQALVGALKLSLSLMQNASIQSKLAVDITELAIDASYGWLARAAGADRVEQLVAIQEKQLQAVKSLGRLYTADVDTRKLLVQARRHLDSRACR